MDSQCRVRRKAGLSRRPCWPCGRLKCAEQWNSASRSSFCGRRYKVLVSECSPEASRMVRLVM